MLLLESAEMKDTNTPSLTDPHWPSAIHWH